MDGLETPTSPSGQAQPLDDLRWLLELAQEAGLAELEVVDVDSGFEARIVTGLPVAARNPTTTETAPAEAPAIPEGAWVVTSPLDGIFYRAKTPNDPPFVEVGEQVKKGETVCIVEVFKLVNNVEASCRGTVHAILVENEQEVKRDQPLMYIVPTPGPAL